MEIPCRHPGPDVREQPAAHRMVDLAWFPMAFVRWIPVGLLIDRAEQFGTLWENRIWKSLRLPDGLQPGERRLRFGQKAMQRNIEPEARRLFAGFGEIHHTPTSIENENSWAR